MKKLFSLFLVSLICFVADAQDKPFLTKKFNASQIKALEVNTSGGGITVMGSNASEAVVEVYIKGSTGKTLSRSEIEDRLEDYTLEIKRDGNTLICFAKNNEKWSWKSGLTITFKIYSPVNVDTELLTSGGGIKMENLKGNLRFSTSGGGLDLAGLSGEVKGRTSGGGIKIRNSEDNIDLSTSGGGIQADEVAGNVRLSTSGGGITLKNMYGVIKANTSGGGVHVDNVEGELNTSTSGGSIHLSGIKGSAKATTSGGSIHADIDQVGDYLVLHSSGGGISVQMPFNKGMNVDIKGDRVTMHDYKNFNGSFEKDHIRGTVNGGGADVKISSSSGNVSIN